MTSRDFTVRITLDERYMRESYESLVDDMRYYRERDEFGYDGVNIPPSWEETVENFFRMAKEEVVDSGPPWTLEFIEQPSIKK
jgi:hypothetical protein